MTLERATLAPARPGLTVPDPDHGGDPLPEEGREVVLSSYWHRRLQDGDVRRVGASSAAAKVKEPKQPKG